MIQVQQGHEPPNFTGFFGAWDAKIWEVCKYNSTYLKLLLQAHRQTGSRYDSNWHNFLEIQHNNHTINYELQKDFDSIRNELETLRVINVPQLKNHKKEVPKYSLDILREADPDKLPDDVDPLHKEVYHYFHSRIRHRYQFNYEQLLTFVIKFFPGSPDWRGLHRSFCNGERGLWKSTTVAQKQPQESSQAILN